MCYTLIQEGSIGIWGHIRVREYRLRESANTSWKK